MSKLVDRLNEYRLKNRISQEQLPKMLGVTHATVNRWFNGHTKPNMIQTYHIEQLLAGKGPKK